MGVCLGGERQKEDAGCEKKKIYANVTKSFESEKNVAHLHQSYKQILTDRYGQRTKKNNASNPEGTRHLDQKGKIAHYGSGKYNGSLVPTTGVHNHREKS